MTNYLMVIEVLAMHEDLIALDGGAAGLRDLGALESALFRPQSGHYSDLIEEAAALWESLSQNHPFVDGNKRTAFAATYTFLLINGLEICAEPDMTYDFIIELHERNQFMFEHLTVWLRNNLA